MATLKARLERLETSRAVSVAKAKQQTPKWFNHKRWNEGVDALSKLIDGAEDRARQEAQDGLDPTPYNSARRSIENLRMCAGAQKG